MYEGEAGGVERLPREVPQCRGDLNIPDLLPSRCAVYLVADDGPSARGEMYADLMRPAGEQPAAKQRGANARCFHASDPFEGCHALGAGRRGCPRDAPVL